MTLHSGRIVYRIDYGNDIRLEINTTKKYNTGQWISIEVAREFTSKRSTENGSLKVNNEEPLTGSPTTPITSSLLPDFSRSSFYLGGVPPGYEYVNAMASGADNAFLGCMKDIQINGETYDPLETSNRYGVEAACKEVISKYKTFLRLSIGAHHFHCYFIYFTEPDSMEMAILNYQTIH